MNIHKFNKMFVQVCHDPLCGLLWSLRCRDRLPALELRRRLRLARTHGQLAQKRNRCFSHASGHPTSELTRVFLLPTPPNSSQLKTQAATFKEGLDPLCGPRVRLDNNMPFLGCLNQSVANSIIEPTRSEQMSSQV